MINCVTGAYQSSGILFITPRDHPDQAKEVELTLPLKDDQGDPQTISWFTDVSYDPKTAMLTHTARGRGSLTVVKAEPGGMTGIIFS